MAHRGSRRGTQWSAATTSWAIANLKPRTTLPMCQPFSLPYTQSVVIRTDTKGSRKLYIVSMYQPTRGYVIPAMETVVHSSRANRAKKKSPGYLQCRTPTRSSPQVSPDEPLAAQPRKDGNTPEALVSLTDTHGLETLAVVTSMAQQFPLTAAMVSWAFQWCTSSSSAAGLFHVDLLRVAIWTMCSLGKSNLYFVL